MNKYKQSLDNISSIDLDRVLDELGYEEADKISVYGVCDYPNLEMSGDIQNLLELVNKEEVLEKRVSVLGKALVSACDLLAMLYGSPIDVGDVILYKSNTPICLILNDREKWKENLLKVAQHE